VGFESNEGELKGQKNERRNNGLGEERFCAISNKEEKKWIGHVVQGTVC
jgi:hypothetical protein